MAPALALVTVSSPLGGSGESYHRLWLDLLHTAPKDALLFHAQYDGVPSCAELVDQGVKSLCVVGVDCGSGNWSSLRKEEWATRLVRLISDFIGLDADHDGERRVLSSGLGSHAVAQAVGCEVSANPSSSDEGGAAATFIVEAAPVHASPALAGTIGNWLRETRADSLSPPPRVLASASGGAAEDLGSTLYLLESHGEQVTSLPRDCEILASSKKTQAEIWAWRENALAFQCHPELTPALFRGSVVPKVAEAIPGAEEGASSSLDEVALDSEVLAAMARHFLEGGSPLESQRDASKDPSLSPLSAASSGLAASSSAIPVPSSLDEAGGVLDTARRLFNSVSEAIRSEFRIPQMEYELLGKMNRLASEKYEHMADFTAGLAVFAESLREKEESLRPLAGQIGGLEQQLSELEALVVDLDEYSKRLENRVKKYVFS